MTEQQTVLNKLASSQQPPNQELLNRKELRAKLRTYEILVALRNGYMPTTTQFTGNLRWLLDSGILESRNRKLRVKGRDTIRDLRAWIEAIAEEAQNKNSGNEIQEFIYELSMADVEYSILSCKIVES
jgi:Family of unknown function (DUF5923)